jgi:hypothetical protein
MKYAFKYAMVVIILVTTQSVIAQTENSGLILIKAVDSTTGEVLPRCSFYLSSQHRWLLADEKGTVTCFISDSLMIDTVIVSHVGFGTKMFLLNYNKSPQQLTVILAPVLQLLQNMTVYQPTFVIKKALLLLNQSAFGDYMSAVDYIEMITQKGNLAGLFVGEGYWLYKVKEEIKDRSKHSWSTPDITVFKNSASTTYRINRGFWPQRASTNTTRNHLFTTDLFFFRAFLNQANWDKIVNSPKTTLVSLDYEVDETNQLLLRLELALDKQLGKKRLVLWMNESLTALVKVEAIDWSFQDYWLERHEYAKRPVKYLSKKYIAIFEGEGVKRKPTAIGYEASYTDSTTEYAKLQVHERVDWPRSLPDRFFNQQQTRDCYLQLENSDALIKLIPDSILQLAIADYGSRNGIVNQWQQNNRYWFSGWDGVQSAVITHEPLGMIYQRFGKDIIDYVEQTLTTLRKR